MPGNFYTQNCSKLLIRAYKQLFFKGLKFSEEGHVTKPMDVSVQEVDLQEHGLIIPVRCALLPVG